MKKLCLILILSIVALRAFQPPSQPLLVPTPVSFKPQKTDKEPILPYYGSHAFNTAAPGKQHAPMLILFDPVNSEPETGNTPSITTTLAFSLVNPLGPILVSGYLLKNLLIRTRTYDSDNFHSKNLGSRVLKKIFEQAEFTSSAWSVYNVPQSAFVLLVPKVITDLFNRTGKKIGLKATLPSLDSLLADKSYQEIIAWLEKNKPVQSIINLVSSEEFKKLFAYDITPHLEKIFDNKNEDKSTPIWDIFFEGHGYINPAIIAGLLPEYFNKVLSFFDRRIKTGILFVRSCLAGGQNRTLLETTQEGVQTKHNFIIILGSITDSIVPPTKYGREQMITDFFNLAGFIQDKGTSINNLIRSIVDFNMNLFSYHGATGFPQIWFPGGYGFQTPQIVNEALTIGNVFLKTHQENQEPIFIDNVLIVLLYPRIIDVKLIISPFNVQANLKKQWNNFAFVFENSFFSNVPESIQKSMLDELKAEKLLPDYLSELPEIAQQNSPANPNYYIYPQIIAMAPKDSQYHFSEIQVSSELRGKQVAGGILQFIRDTFFDPSRESDHDYYIDSITGTNDISLTLAASRILAQRPDKHPLEDILKDRINKEITLKNVVISPYHNHISFQINNTTWIFGNKEFIKDPTKEMRWNFTKRTDTENYEKAYKANTQKLTIEHPAQKNISANLKEKQRQMLLKKAAEIKKKEPALKQAKQMPLTLIPRLSLHPQSQKLYYHPTCQRNLLAQTRKERYE